MKLDPKSAASALALTAGIVSVICAILVAIAPDFLFSSRSSIIHLLNGETNNDADIYLSHASGSPAG